MEQYLSLFSKINSEGYEKSYKTDKTVKYVSLGNFVIDIEKDKQYLFFDSKYLDQMKKRLLSLFIPSHNEEINSVTDFNILFFGQNFSEFLQNKRSIESYNEIFRTSFDHLYDNINTELGKKLLKSLRSTASNFCKESEFINFNGINFVHNFNYYAQNSRDQLTELIFQLNNVNFYILICSNPNYMVNESRTISIQFVREEEYLDIIISQSASNIATHLRYDMVFYYNFGQILSSICRLKLRKLSFNIGQIYLNNKYTIRDNESSNISASSLSETRQQIIDYYRKLLNII